MKKLALLSIGLVVALVSCKGKDEEKNTNLPPSELILGTWNLDKIHAITFENGVKADEEIDTELWRMIVEPNYYTMVDDATGDQLIGLYTLTADSLFLTQDGDVIPFKLNKLSKNELYFTQVDKYMFDSIQYRDEITFMFEK